MLKAYLKLHREGYAHSIETWHKGELVGGLYGVSLGKVFFGESMFHKMRDASKFAFHQLVQVLIQWDFEMIDAQQETEHMKSLGAKSIPREEFMKQLESAVSQPTYKGNWNKYI